MGFMDAWPELWLSKKMDMLVKISILGGVLVLAATTMVGCGSGQDSKPAVIAGEQPKATVADTAVTQAPSEARLRERVQGRWDALIKRDFTAAYQYFSPAYRKLTPLEKYSARFGSAVAWESITITGVSLGEGKADVSFELSYQLAIPTGDGAALGESIGSISKSMKETWLWSEGEWWFVELPDGSAPGKA